MKRWKIILLVAVTVSLSAAVALSAAPPVPPGITARHGATDSPEDVAPGTLTI